MKLKDNYRFCQVGLGGKWHIMEIATPKLSLCGYKGCNTIARGTQQSEVCETCMRKAIGLSPRQCSVGGEYLQLGYVVKDAEVIVTVVEQKCRCDDFNPIDNKYTALNGITIISELYCEWLGADKILCVRGQHEYEDNCMTIIPREIWPSVKEAVLEYGRACECMDALVKRIQYPEHTTIMPIDPADLQSVSFQQLIVLLRLNAEAYGEGDFKAQDTCELQKNIQLLQNTILERYNRITGAWSQFQKDVKGIL